MNKAVFLGFPILELSKIVMCEFKPKYGEEAKLCYMDTNSFIVCIKTDDIHKDIAEDLETKFDTSNCELGTPLPKAKNEKVIRLMKDELGDKIMTKFVGLIPKTSSYLIDNGSKNKKAKSTKRCVIKRKLKFKATQLENKKTIN